MNAKTVIMDFSGVYKEENFIRKKMPNGWILQR